MSHIWFWSTFFAIITFTAGYFQVSQSIMLETAPLHKPRIRSQAFYPNGRYGRSDPELDGEVNENALESRSNQMINSMIRTLSGGPRAGSNGFNSQLLCSYTGIRDLFTCVSSDGNTVAPPKRLPSLQSISASSGV